jgi:hypothetical protein
MWGRGRTTTEIERSRDVGSSVIDGRRRAVYRAAGALEAGREKRLTSPDHRLYSYERHRNCEEQEPMSTRARPDARLSSEDATAVRILAHSMVRELKKQGYGLRHIVALAGELIGFACESIRSKRAPTAES